MRCVVNSSTCSGMTSATHLALIVEDDKAIQEILTIMLESNGFGVVVSDSCTRAELQAKSRPPDIMIIGLGLPGRDGIYLVKAVRTWSLAR